MIYHALVPAAGTGSRIAAAVADPVPKQYLQVAGQPLIRHALAALCATPGISNVFVVLAPDDTLWPGPAMAALGPKLRVLRCGGETRAQSVANGLREMEKTLGPIGDDWVLVHDAARPCLSDEMLARLCDELADDPVGGLLAVPVADTLKREDTGGRVDATIAREGLWQAQTPQMFRYGVLTRALADARSVTDEAGAIEAAGLAPKLVKGDATNLKVTYPADLPLAELIMMARRGK